MSAFLCNYISHGKIIIFLLHKSILSGPFIFRQHSKFVWFWTCFVGFVFKVLMSHSSIVETNWATLLFISKNTSCLGGGFSSKLFK